MKIISIQRLGAFGIIQYINDAGEVKSSQFDPAKTDAEVVASISPRRPAPAAVKFIESGKAHVKAAAPAPPTPPTVEQLKARAKELGIRNAHSMKPETLAVKIAEAAKG